MHQYPPCTEHHSFSYPATRIRILADVVVYFDVATSSYQSSLELLTDCLRSLPSNPPLQDCSCPSRSSSNPLRNGASRLWMRIKSVTCTFAWETTSTPQLPRLVGLVST